jgi:hypothetical protein
MKDTTSKICDYLAETSLKLSSLTMLPIPTVFKSIMESQSSHIMKAQLTINSKLYVNIYSVSMEMFVR